MFVNLFACCEHNAIASSNLYIWNFLIDIRKQTPNSCDDQQRKSFCFFLFQIVNSICFGRYQFNGDFDFFSVRAVSIKGLNAQHHCCLFKCLRYTRDWTTSTVFRCFICSHFESLLDSKVLAGSNLTVSIQHNHKNVCVFVCVFLSK